MALRVVVTVWLPVLLASGAAAEYQDRRLNQVYRPRQGPRYDCWCDPVGSVGRRCDFRTKQCECHPHVIGLSCDRCQAGYFDLRPGVGCRRCGCVAPGSEPNACDPRTGQCYCKRGVGGVHCTACLPGFFGLSSTGCQECGPCERPGHRCDPDTGQCICPPNTIGNYCQHCVRGYWGHNGVTGCKMCDCNQWGSVSTDCDMKTGRCDCNYGFGGRRCDRCALGFYSFSRCRRCQCDPSGTAGCDAEGNCPCDDQGRCRCKKNVRGARCDQCAPNSFGLSADNPDGCTTCFCFTRSGQCSQAEFSWVKLTVPDERAVTLAAGQTQLNVTNSLRVIPGQTGDVTLGLAVPLDTPIYWELPQEFLGDKVRSYNGQLRFRLRSEGGSRPFPGDILATYPLVQLQGHTLVLEYFSPAQQPGPDGLHQVKLHESLWRRKGASLSPVTREMLMVALQNTTHVLIRATEAVDTRVARIMDISWDVAEPTYSHRGPPALGVERCACARQYNGSSCQDPSIGFRRIYKETQHRSEIIIDLIGDVEECQCNGRAATCDPDTGDCQNCTDNTAGPHCDLCATGFYGRPAAPGGCQPCLCPTAEISNALGCTAYYGTSFRCQCRPGYYGQYCDRCDYGYYGDASNSSVGCVPCDCSLAGSVSVSCDPTSGQCLCRNGMQGRDCTRCPPRHAPTANGCQACQDCCVTVLFAELDALEDMAAAVNVSEAPAAPWSQLYAVSNETQRLDDQLTDYIGTQRTLAALEQTLGLQPLTDTLLAQSEELLASLPNKMGDIQSLVDQLKAINESVAATRAEAEETVERLQSYARGDSPSISLDQALAEANAILEELQRRNFTDAQQRAEWELDEACLLREQIESLAINRTAQQEALTRLDDLRSRMEDMAQLIEQLVREPVTKAETLLAEVRAGLKRLAERHQLLSSEAELTENLLTNTSSLQLRLRQLYDQAQGHSIDLSDLQNRLASSNDSLQQRLSELSQLDTDLRLNYVLPAQKHAEQLTREVDRLEGLFQATRAEANMSLAAAQAYQNIVDALKAARQAAEEASQAAQTAYQKAYPKNTDSLVSLGSQAKARSEKLLQSSGMLQSQIKSLSGKMEASKRRLQQINGTIQDAREKNDAVQRDLKGLNMTGLSRSMAASVESTRAADTKTKAVSGRVDTVLSRVDTELKPGLRRLEAATDESVDDIDRLVTNASRDIGQAAKLATKVERNVNATGRLGESVDLKLQQLRNKILKARQAASNIRVSLTANGTSCSRRYRATGLQPSTTSSLRLNYAISQPDVRDALLLYIGATGQQGDFMAVEMVDRRIHFLWNNGGETQTVKHPLELGTSNEQLLSDSHWYTIEVTRIGNLGTLTVRPVSPPEGEPAVPETISAASTAGFSVLNLTPDAPVFVGAPTPPLRPSLTAQRFAGCLDGVSINGQKLGLWNFRSTRDCGACRVGPSDDESSEESAFDGAGYVELPPLPRGPRRGLYVKLSVRTFDADALLFLAANDKKSQFFSLEMRHGHVVLRVGFSKTAVLEVKSNSTCNTGNWVTVTAAQAEHNVLLTVNNDSAKSAAFNPVSGDLPASFDLDLDSSKLYFGGVPPDFDRSPWPQLTFVPLRGCMKDVTAVAAQNLKGGNSAGVTNGCGGQLLKTVEFRDNGYLEIDSYRLKKNSSFGLSFKTSASAGLLLISTFAGKAPADSDLQEYYMLGLDGGRLQLRVNGGTGELLLAADDKLNDNVFHTVSVLKKGRRLELWVADRVVASGQLAPGSSGVKVPGRGGLFLGGLPADLTPPTAVPRAFLGCITDVILGNRLITFDDPVRHERVAIGRCDSALRRSSPSDHQMATEPASTSCHQVKQLTHEGRALKLGDDPHSHVFQPVNKKEFQKDFNISLNFRTFYPNGLLLYNERRRRTANVTAPRFYFTLTLRDGAVVFNARRGSRTMELSTHGHLNDGQWKAVTLSKRGRRYTLTVEGKATDNPRGLGRLRAGNGVYLGGLPKTSYGDRKTLGQKMLETLQTERFKGCMRQLGLRQRVYDLTFRQKTSFKVGQCNVFVEQGTYFGGDAYATYDESFQLGDEVNLAVSFRTTALNGVLISIAGPAGGPALALELSGGEVVFSVRNGSTSPIRARRKFPNKFTACDNRWHSVKAFYAQNQAQLRVDKYLETYGVNGDTERVLTGRFPLYIGGLPHSDVPGNNILLQQDNFMGCIRNIEINKMRRDWIDMAQLSNVLLNSCPVEK